MAQKELTWLRNQGIEPTDDDIVTFHHLGELAQFGGIKDPALLRFAAIRVGSILFYPMTIGASLWYSETALEWFEGNDEMALLCLLYALAHSREPQVLEEIDTRFKCFRRVRKWAKKVNLTSAEAEKAVEMFLPQAIYSAEIEADDGEMPQPDSNDYSPALAILTRFHGKDRHHWLWNEPADYCMNLIQKTIEMESSDDAPNPANPAIQGQVEFLKLRQEIMKRSADG